MASVLGMHDAGKPAPWRWCFYVGAAVLTAVVIALVPVVRGSEWLHAALPSLARAPPAVDGVMSLYPILVHQTASALEQP